MTRVSPASAEKPLITVADLEDQLGQDPRPILHCKYCSRERSANQADYFDSAPSYKFLCCGTRMHLVIKKVVYEDAPLPREQLPPKPKSLWRRIRLRTCDLCNRDAQWKHPAGGYRCAKCPRPEKE